MVQLTFTPDLSELALIEGDLARFIERAGRVVGARAVEIVRAELPRRTGKTATNTEGQHPAPGVTEVAVPYSEALPARGATAISAGGRRRRIRLAAQPAVDIAELLIQGRAAQRPRRKRALLIGVDGAPATGAHIVDDDGRTYVVRRRSGRAKPNRFDLRAERRLLGELDALVLTIPLD